MKDFPPRPSLIEDRRNEVLPLGPFGTLGLPENSFITGHDTMAALDPEKDFVPQAGSPNAMSLALGINSIVPGHQAWLAEREKARLAAIQNDPNIHSFNEPIDPSGPPVSLHRDKLPIPPNPVLAGRQPGATYNTPLGPGMEQFFRMWLAHNKVPFNPDATAPQDYDMRGFYQAAMQGNPKAQAAVDPNDGRIHYNDFWKTPSHETFGRESQWGPANGPVWNQQDQLLSQGGRVLFDDRAAPAPFGPAVPR